VRYPLVEILTAAVFVLLALRFADEPWVIPAFLWLGGVGVALALIDLDVKRLPDALTLPSYPIAAALLAVAAVAGPGADVLVRVALGAVVLLGMYFLLWFGTAGRGMGLGDVKLSGLLGAHLAWVGWGTLAVGAFSAFALGGLTSLALIVGGRAGRRTRIPFGPFMLAGALLAILVGEPLASGYRELTGV
jgi:leader peptidase (prepilin peptidase)/N-methyltransferase